MWRRRLTRLKHKHKLISIKLTVIFLRLVKRGFNCCTSHMMAHGTRHWATYWIYIYKRTKTRDCDEWQMTKQEYRSQQLTWYMNNKWKIKLKQSVRLQISDLCISWGGRLPNLEEFDNAKLWGYGYEQKEKAASDFTFYSYARRFFIT